MSLGNESPPGSPHGRTSLMDRESGLRLIPPFPREAGVGMRSLARDFSDRTARSASVERRSQHAFRAAFNGRAATEWNALTPEEREEYTADHVRMVISGSRGRNGK